VRFNGSSSYVIIKSLKYLLNEKQQHTLEYLSDAQFDGQGASGINPRMGKITAGKMLQKTAVRNINLNLNLILNLNHRENSSARLNFWATNRFNLPAQAKQVAKHNKGVQAGIFYARFIRFLGV